MKMSVKDTAVVVLITDCSLGTLIHAPPARMGQYEHSSIVATVIHKIFDPAPGEFIVIQRSDVPRDLHLIFKMFC